MLPIRRRRHAFTLVEVLVVLGVLVILIAILLPAAVKARQQAKRAACAATLHSLGHALRMYAGDHHDRLPNGGPPGTVLDPAGVDAVLVALNERYVRAPAAFRCPADADDPPTAIVSGAYLAVDSARTSYDFYSLFWLPEMGPKLARIRDAPIAWDMNGASPPGRATNHKGGGNVVFADGHAAWQPADEWDGSNWPHPADLRYE